MTIHNKTSKKIYVETKGREFFDIFTGKTLYPDGQVTEEGSSPEAEIEGEKSIDEFASGNPRTEEPYIKRPGESLKAYINFRPGESTQWTSKETGRKYVLSRGNDAGNSFVLLNITIVQ